MIQTGIEFFTKWGEKAWGAFGDIILKQVEHAWNFIRRTIDNVLQVIKGIIDVFIGLFTGDWGKALDGIKSIWSGIWDQIVNILTFAKDTLGNIVLALGRVLRGAWERIVDKAVEMFQAMKDKAIAKAEELVEWMVGLPGKVVSALGSLVTTLGTKGQDLLGGFLAGAKAKWLALKSWVGELPGKIVSAVGDLGNLLKGAGKKILQGLIDGIKSKLAGLKDTLSGVTSFIPDWKGPADTDAKLLAPAGKLIMGGLIGGMGDMEGDLEAKLRGITAQIQGGVTVTEASGHAGGVSISVEAQTDANPDEIADAIAQRLVLAGVP